MKHPAARTAILLAAVSAALMLAACGSSGGGDDTPDPIDLLLDDRVIRLQRVVERSEILLMPGVHVGYTFSIGGDEGSETEPFFQPATCTGAERCVTETLDPADASTITLNDLINFSTFELGPAEVVLGSRGGLDTVEITSSVNISGSLPEDIVDLTSPSSTAFGFWGVHGFAGVVIGDGPVSGRVRETLVGVETTIPFDGVLSFALAYAMGDVTGMNPTGVGSLTWEGVAEVASARTFERRTGTVNVIIADLTQAPLRASVNIVDIDGFRVGPAEWSNVEITNGHFTHGAVASQDYLEGNFHGPNHEETYGVFDTGSYTGAFGAKLAN